jgi:hypothetical protein
LRGARRRDYQSSRRIFPESTNLARVSPPIEAYV